MYFDAQNHTEEAYNADGYLESISYQDGFRVDLVYKTTSYGAGKGKVLSYVRDSGGRDITFIYNKNNYLSSIKLPDGGSIRYRYKNGSCDDALGFLLEVVEYQDGSSRKYNYDETKWCGQFVDSYLTGIRDEAGSYFASFEYESEDDAVDDPNGEMRSRRAIASLHAGDADKHEFAYQTDGSVRVTYPEGSTALLSFVSRKGSILLSAVDAPCNPICNQPARSHIYDDKGYLSSLEDFKGNITETSFDDAGLLIEKVDAKTDSSQRTTRITWNTALRMPLSRVISDPEGRVVSNGAWSYNSRGQVLASCELDPNLVGDYACVPSGQVPAGVRRTTYAYCESIDGVQCPRAGLLLTTIGSRTDVRQVTTYSYYMSNSSAANCDTPGAACYQAGDLHTITDAAGHITTIASYDGAGRITRIIDTNGINTDMTYTARGWLASRSVNGQTTTFTYTPYGAVQTVTDADNVTTTYGYDAAHRLVKITDAQGNYVQYTLDAAGNKTAEQVYDASGTLHQSLSRTFSTLGQLTKVTDGLNHTVFDANTSTSYDANSNLVQSADGLGIQHKLGYDALNRLVQTVDNYNGTDSATANTRTQYTYDSLDRLTQLTDPSHLATTYSYDGLGNATGQQSPDTGTTSRTFDAAGNVLTRTDAKGIIATTTYDVLNRPLTVSYPDSTQNITYAYDEANSVTGCSTSYPIGRLTRVVEHNVTTLFCYDAQGRVLSKRQSVGSGFSVGMPGLKPCPAGRMCISDSADPLPDTITYRYTAAGRLNSLTYASGTQVAYTHDRNGRIQAITVTPPNGSATTVVGNVTYQPFGPVSGYTLGNGQHVTRAYDANYRLTDLTSPAFTLHVARDAMGNITAIGDAPGANPVTETYSYDPLYRLTAITKADGNTLESVTYNQAGDRLNKTDSGLATGAYSYNPNTHQLIATGNAARSVDANGNTTAISQAGSVYGFGYNDRNRMTVAQLAGNTIGSYIYNALNQRVQKVANGVTQRFNYNEASQILAEYGVSNRDYIWMDDIPVANVDMASGSSTVSYVIADQLGTPRAIADGSGNALWVWAYRGNAWGEQQPTSNSYMYNLRFPGQYVDVETELHSNVNRDYDPLIGRYNQADPIGYEGGQWSLYAYVNNNPLSLIDPMGLEGAGVGMTPEQLRQLGEAHGKYSNEYLTGARDFVRNYRAMREANTIGADKYFHCKANCEATQRGQGGKDAACNISNARERFDQSIKGDPASASAEDQMANVFGRNHSAEGSCAQVCSIFRPSGLDPSY